MKVDQKTKFQVFLEGVQIPFSNATISEAEGALPSASISFPSNYGALRVLPGTILQIFGPVKEQDVEEIILLFEGEVTGVQYSKGPAGRTASLVCNSLLASFYKATIRPQDGLVTGKLRKQLGPEDIPTSISSKISNNSGIASSLTNNLISEWTAVSKPVIDKNLDKLVLNTKDNLIYNFLHLMGINYISAGDYLPIPQFFLRYYELFDPYFGVQSLSYGLTRSLFAFPNPAKTTPFINKVTTKMMNKQLSLSTNVDLPLLKVLHTFMELTNYGMIAPSSFTGSQIFWGNVSDLDYKVPLRLYFMPNLENSPPAKFNMIFPNQVLSYRYGRDMASEVTRMVGEIGLVIDTNLNLPKGSNRTHVIPDIDYAIDTEHLLHGGLTVEEGYRGVNAGYQVMDPWLSSALYSGKGSVVQQWQKMDQNKRPQNPLVSAGWEENNDTNVLEYTKGFETSFEQMVAKAYAAGKYGKRMFNVQCEWSPYRLVGVPGVVMDENGPSIVGVLSAINTQIDAAGNISSTLSFRSPRLVFDNEMGSSFQESQATIDDYLVNDFTNDGALSVNNFMFDPYFYDFLNIGFSVYTYLATGLDNYNTKPFSSYASSGQIYNRFKTMLNSGNWETQKGDYSVLDNIRDPKTFVLLDTATAFAGESPNDEVRNAKYLYYSLSNWRQTYEAKKKLGGEVLSNFVTSVTKRDIIRKADYFSYIGINEIAPIKSLHYKDSTTIFNSPTAVVNFKDEYAKIRSMKKYLDTLIEYPDIATSNAGPESDTHLLENQIIRMETFNSLLASWIRISKYRELKTEGGVQIELDVAVPLIDISAIGNRAIYQTTDSINAFFEEAYPSYDSFTVYYQRYQNDIERAEKEWALRVKLVNFANTDLELQKEGNTSTTNKKLDSKIFMPYNIIRYAHVRKAFSDFLRRGALTVIKN